ncbi:MAG TPA: prolyl oligopeptidase family serine peptidase [Thermoanaerobaculia bacterium]|nr:prolyl oligopeptidase family serine peptidase [Thermoanaerobaculia bacterium]HQR68102.1 prolyl oligopeptidase family serine peptidase [Thermoanaerobaculia bacterium]
MRGFRSLVSAAAVLFVAAGAAATAGAQPADDPFAWLEEVQGEKALAWVKQQNAKTTALLEARPEYRPVFTRTLEILDSKEKIPFPSLRGETVYNFWKDDAHERGIWRRTSLASYRTATPQWETVLDVDALAKAEGKSWVFQGATCLAPAYVRCMVSLSVGGSDASVRREFDAAAKQFVAGGFSLPEAKSRVSWRDENTLWVGTDFGPGSLTTSGYPRIVKLWKRGTPLAEARTVYEGKTSDMSVAGHTEILSDGRYDVVTRTPAFYRHESFLVLGDRLVKLDLPEDSQLREFFRDRLLFSLRSDWTVGGKTYRAGSLLAAPVDDLLKGARRYDVLFEPSERVSLAAVARTRDRVLVGTLDNVRSRVMSVALEDGSWKTTEMPTPGLGTTSFSATDDQTNTFFFVYQDFTTPTSLWLSAGGGEAAKVKSMPAFFDAAGMNGQQLEAVSKDGTKIPYFLVTPKGFVADGKAPTLLYGYGGFEVSEVPRYSGVVGSAWLARGGVYVLANIRGGGEFGPAWHNAAVRERHIHNFEDFAAVARDLVARKITSARHLGIMGGSQGGLLVGGTFTLYPDLFHAVVAQVPLADMKRFSHLLAGASWMAEYGDPDKPEDWAFIRTWSPYELLKPDAKYPTPFYWTNTRDDRVHPAHARKMVAKMEAQGHPVYYFENTEGGHGSGAVNRQTATITALEYSYLWMMLR